MQENTESEEFQKQQELDRTIGLRVEALAAMIRTLCPEGSAREQALFRLIEVRFWVLASICRTDPI